VSLLKDNETTLYNAALTAAIVEISAEIRAKSMDLVIDDAVQEG
jgi:hypothetical protein